MNIGLGGTSDGPVTRRRRQGSAGDERRGRRHEEADYLSDFLGVGLATGRTEGRIQGDLVASRPAACWRLIAVSTDPARMAFTLTPSSA